MTPSPPPSSPERRARIARAALQNEAVMEAFAELEREAEVSYRGTALSDVAGREIAFLQLRALDEVRAKLRNWVNDSKET